MSRRSIGREYTRRLRPGRLIAVGVGVALFAGWQAIRFLPELNQPSPLAALAPATAPAPPRSARRLVLVLIDGLRLDASRGLPFLDGLRARGVDGAARAAYPTLSLPNHAALLTGVEPRWSGIRTNDASGPLPLDSLPARARAAGLRTVFVTDRSRAIPELFGDQLDGEVDVTGGLPEADLVLLVLSDVDRAGHRHGGASAEYRRAARDTDERLARLCAGLDLARDAIVVVSDHGHLDRGGHGGLGREVEEVPLVVAGAGARPELVPKGARLADVAGLAAGLLGLSPPGHAARAGALAAELARAELQGHREARTWRLLGALALLGALGALAARRLPIHALLAAPVGPLLFFGLVVAFESPPGVPGDAPSLLHEVSPYLLAAALAQVVAGALVLRRARDRPAAAAGLLTAGMLAAAVPALAAWVVIGPTGAALLPPPRILLLPPLAALALAVQALCAAAILAVEYHRTRP